MGARCCPLTITIVHVRALHTACGECAVIHVSVEGSHVWRRYFQRRKKVFRNINLRKDLIQSCIGSSL